MSSSPTTCGDVDSTKAPSSPGTARSVLRSHGQVLPFLVFSSSEDDKKEIRNSLFLSQKTLQQVLLPPDPFYFILVRFWFILLLPRSTPPFLFAVLCRELTHFPRSAFQLPKDKNTSVLKRKKNQSLKILVRNSVVWNQNFFCLEN